MNPGTNTPISGALGSPSSSAWSGTPLSAAGYAACFQSALGVVGRRAKVDTSASTVEAGVTLGTISSGGYGLAVTMRVTVPGVDPDTARRLTEAAHQGCPHSNATRGNIDVSLAVG